MPLFQMQALWCCSQISRHPPVVAAKPVFWRVSSDGFSFSPPPPSTMSYYALKGLLSVTLGIVQGSTVNKAQRSYVLLERKVCVKPECVLDEHVIVLSQTLRPAQHSGAQLQVGVSLITHL